MDKVFELVYKSGPHGDCCSSYTLKFYGEPTLREFIQQVLEQRNDEWGEFYVHYDDASAPKYATVDEREREITIDYKYGHIDKTYDGNRYDKSLTPSVGFSDLVNQILDKKLNINWKGNYANGGWSSMSYWIKVIS